MANPDKLYPVEQETSIEQINEALLGGRQLGGNIANQSTPPKDSLPGSINFYEGNSYYNGKK